MTRTGSWIAAGVVVASNLVALTGAVLDRRIEPEATLVLTERELRLPPLEAENTALTLRLRWTDPARSEGAGQWFDRAKLEELGFDCALPLEGQQLERCRALPPRKAFAVLEHEGEAWERHRKLLEADMARYAEAPGSAPASRPPDASAPGPRGPAESLEERLAGSRLVVVDVGANADELRRHHPDRSRSVVVPAVVRLFVVERSKGEPAYLAGRVVSVQPFELHVPSALREVLDHLREDAGAGMSAGPRYRVTVKWGRRAPWISSVERITRPD